MARRMADDDFRSWQWEHRYDPQVREINKLVNDLVKERPGQKVPYVAPHYDASRARAGYVCRMDDDAATDISCPTCSAGMDSGWVAMWNPIIGQKVRWQPTRPGYARVHVPQGAPVPRCPSCATVVVPPDATYD